MLSYNARLITSLRSTLNFINKPIRRTKITASYCVVSPRPEEIEIPLDKIEMKACRSSGPGGQNVNKLNTKVEIRFNVKQADWIPDEVKGRLMQYQATKLSKEGDLIVTSQENRTQNKNREDCMDKIREMISEAYVEPKDRHMWVGLSKKGKEQRRDDKRQRGAVKQNRKVRDFGNDDY